MSDLTIGIIEPVGGHGGMDYYDYGLALGLGESNVNVRLYTCDVTEPRTYKNVTTILNFKNIWGNNFFRKVSNYLWSHYLSFKDLKKHNGSIAHLHFFSLRTIDMAVLLLGRARKLKLVVTIHDVNAFDNSEHSFIEKYCHRLIDGVIVHNQTSLKELLKKETIKAPVAIIPHGNYLPFIEPIKTNISEGEGLTILFFGQIKEVKGLDILIKAVAIVHKAGFNIRLKIAGRPWKSNLTEYVQLIEDLKITDIVESTFKYIPDEDVAKYYENTDLVILPYREIYQSGVLLLTMSYGVPVLCSSLEAFLEIITPDVNGYIFKTENVNDLADQIIKIMHNKQGLKEVAANSNKLISEKYDWVHIGELTKTFFDSVL